MLRRMLVGLVALAAFDGALAHADKRGTLRFGMLPLELESSADTPLFGASVERVVDKYNAAAAAHDRVAGGTTARIDAGDLGVAETLFVFAPGLEVGSGAYFFRLEAPIGLSDDMHSFGIGMYPINLQLTLRRSIVIYASGGGSASWLDRRGTGDVGGLVTLRAAVGARIARHVVAEVGYNAFVIGGSFNKDRLAEMTSPDAMQVPQPSQAISAGEARGIVDASLGLAF
jgi:hypothetical protein